MTDLKPSCSLKGQAYVETTGSYYIIQGLQHVLLRGVGWEGEGARRGHTYLWLIHVAVRQ